MKCRLRFQKHVTVGSLTLLRSMQLSIKFETVKSGWFILYIEGFHQKITLLSLNIEFVLEYSVDADEKSFVQYFLCVFTVCHIHVYFKLI